MRIGLSNKKWAAKSHGLRRSDRRLPLQLSDKLIATAFIEQLLQPFRGHWYNCQHHLFKYLRPAATAQLDEGTFEVVLTLTVTAKVEEDTAFLAEIQQAGIFSINGLNENELHHTLGAFCPSILFPYAREAVDSMVIKGSFPALMLAPVNFDALYAQQMQQRTEQEAAGEAQH